MPSNAPSVSIFDATTTFSSANAAEPAEPVASLPTPLRLEHVLSIAAERFERRLAQEIAGLEMGLRKEMHEGFAAIRQEMSNQRAELLKWSFAFWIGQLAAMCGLLAFMLRAR